MVDIGCDVGRDVFILSKLVGENGHVIGIDSDVERVNSIGKKNELIGFEF